MRAVLVIAILICLSISCVSAADGPSTSVAWTPDDYVSQVSAAVYLQSSSKLGYDSTEHRYPYDTWDDLPYGISAWFRRDAGVNGWDGPSGWYSDQRLPPPSPGSSLVLTNLYVWANPSYAYDVFKIGYMDGGFAHPEEWVRTLRLVKVPDSITYNGPREWTIPLYANKSSGFLPNGALPAYKSTDPLSGYQFEIEIQHLAVPEPSSVTALALGLAGISGCALRRRRH